MIVTISLLPKLYYLNYINTLLNTQVLQTCVYVVMDFQVRYVWEDSLANLALIELLFARFNRCVCGLQARLLVYVLTVALLVYHVVPIGLKAFAANLVNNVY